MPDPTPAAPAALTAEARANLRARAEAVVDPHTAPGPDVTVVMTEQVYRFIRAANADAVLALLAERDRLAARLVDAGRGTPRPYDLEDAPEADPRPAAAVLLADAMLAWEDASRARAPKAEIDARYATIIAARAVYRAASAAPPAPARLDEATHRLAAAVDVLDHAALAGPASRVARRAYYDALAAYRAARAGTGTGEPA